MKLHFERTYRFHIHGRKCAKQEISVQQVAKQNKKYSKKTWRFENWICFHLRLKQERHIFSSVAVPIIEVSSF
jgi:hypothetical protein